MDQTSRRSFANIYPPYTKILAIMFCACSLVIVPLAIYVYRHIDHQKSDIEIYLFAFPGMQAVLSIHFLFQALFWRRILPGILDSDVRAKAAYPNLRELDTALVFTIVVTGMSLVNVILSGASIFRSMEVMLGYF